MLEPFMWFICGLILGSTLYLVYWFLFGRRR